ncbi:CSEP0058 putative effector protein [Blumeria hordei DH14]|uniref:CSEP0058 putative effector protein n=1 Tax=Blumeria graminis f. sp. hordei (strain DH14) TaxID=546991 RepID=N1JDI3_BLUG1|nr:CSEP0058 putative effector protein [Blumeria hordei DH14]
MKFISTATTAALAGILLLAPATYGNRYYKCELSDPVSEADVIKMVSDRTLEKNADIHPKVPTGESHKSYMFMKRTYANRPRITAYLVQVYGDPKEYQLSLHAGGRWHLCSLEDES